MGSEIFPGVLYELFDLRYKRISDDSEESAIERARGIAYKTAAYTVTLADEILLLSGTFAVSLLQQTAVSLSDQSKEYTFVNVGTGTITLTPYSGDTIGGESTLSLPAGAAVTIIGNGGTDWQIGKALQAVLADTATSATSATSADTADTATVAETLEDDTSTPREASATPGANKIPVADADGKLDSWVSPIAQQLFRIPDSIAKSFYTYQNCGWVMKDGSVRMCGMGANSALGLGTSVSDHYTPVTPGFPALTGTAVKELHISGNSCYALMENGDVYSWGANGYGQLGQGHTNAVPVPTKIASLSNITKIVLSQANGTYYAYASAFFLDTSGRVWACGYNGYGQLGVGDTTNRSTPIQVTGSVGWKDIVAGASYHTSVHAILSDDTAVSWGYNTYGALGVGDTTHRSAPTAVGSLTSVSKIVCHGDNTYGSIITYWLLSNGQVWTAGYNRIGELGIGSTTQQNSPVQITTNISTVSDIAVAGGNGPHTIALCTDGTLRSWGYNGYGQLGLNNTTTYTTPQTVSIAGSPTISKIWAAGPQSYGVSFAEDTSGYIWSCGYNAYGQLGVGDAANKGIFTKVVGVCFPDAATVEDIQFFGYDASLAVLFLLADGRCLGCGRNLLGMMGIYANPASDIPSYVPTMVMF
jgi:alpha-tubulin suppressor-like RCC1 family protein